MLLSNLFLPLLLPSTVMASGNSSTGSTDERLCREINRLQDFVSLAANATELADKTNNNTSKISEIQAQAPAAATQLDTLTSNSTLVATCAIIDAAEDTKDACQKIQSLETLMAFANNETALEQQTHNDTTKMASIQSKASSLASKLSTLTSNATLMSACTSAASTSSGIYPPHRPLNDY